MSRYVLCLSMPVHYFIFNYLLSPAEIIRKLIVTKCTSDNIHVA